MNVSLQYNTDFLGAIYYDNELQLNSYSVSLQMLTTSSDAVITNIAMERIRAWMQGELANVIFVSDKNIELADMLKIMGGNVCVLPEEPVDQIIGIMLYCKLNAITEDQLLITKLDISSSLGDEVWYQHDDDDVLGPFSADGWWHRKGCIKHTLSQEETEQNIVNLELMGWSEYGLDWPKPLDHTDNKIVRPNFKKDENNEAR